jgi:hypothetical protein
MGLNASQIKQVTLTLTFVAGFASALPAYADIFSSLNNAINVHNNKKEYEKMKIIFDYSNLAFTCTHEADKLPSLDQEADQLFKYARYLEKKEGPKEYSEIGNLYRRASRMKHYKAMGNLQSLLYQGLVPSPDPENEAVDLVEELIKMNVPFGYYIMGTYLEEGFGVKMDRDAAMKYFRKAADLGNPEGQTAVGNLLSYKLFRFQLAREFYACAVDQGYAEAAFQLAMDYKSGSNRNATKYYQKAVERGHEIVAFFMSNSFGQINSPTDQMYYLGFDKAYPERARRYELIAKEINRNPSARFPDIDKIVPLPPIPLPEWDGTFEYKKELEKQIPPPPPPPEPPAPKIEPVSIAPVEPMSTISTKPIGTRCNSGDVCPETGWWNAITPQGVTSGRPKYIEVGSTMPNTTFEFPRRFKWMNDVWGARYKVTSVEWTLFKYRHDDPDLPGSRLVGSNPPQRRPSS